MERKHWHWKPNLEAEARAGNRRALAIVAEGEHPGRYFDGLAHMMDVVRIMREEKENGATHIGIFGSRIQKDSLGRRVHRLLDSDVDILIIKDRPKNLLERLKRNQDNRLFEVTRAGCGEGINVIRMSLDTWQSEERYAHDNTFTRDMMNSVKWLWVKKGHYKLGHVGKWVKTTF
ncbi:MAG TPA: hypothetical protein VF820_03390 [Patescibacteria group bacterium]